MEALNVWRGTTHWGRNGTKENAPVYAKLWNAVVPAIKLFGAGAGTFLLCNRFGGLGSGAVLGVTTVADVVLYKFGPNEEDPEQISAGGSLTSLLGFTALVRGIQFGALGAAGLSLVKLAQSAQRMAPIQLAQNIALKGGLGAVVGVAGLAYMVKTSHVVSDDVRGQNRLSKFLGFLQPIPGSCRCWKGDDASSAAAPPANALVAALDDSDSD